MISEDYFFSWWKDSSVKNKWGVSLIEVYTSAGARWGCVALLQGLLHLQAIFYSQNVSKSESFWEPHLVRWHRHSCSSTAVMCSPVLVPLNQVQHVQSLFSKSRSDQCVPLVKLAALAPGALKRKNEVPVTTAASAHIPVLSIAFFLCGAIADRERNVQWHLQIAVVTHQCFSSATVDPLQQLRAMTKHAATRGRGGKKQTERQGG